MEKPLPAYAGSDPFVFVCYAHTDNALVYPEIQRFQEQGFRIWYDDGIAPGSEWNEAIAQAIETCSVFLYFITPNAVVSEHCRREVNFALEQSCSILAVHLEETDVPSALKLSLSHRQAILKYNLPSERYTSRLETALRDAAAGREDNGEGLSRALEIGDFVLDIASQRLHRNGETHLLDPKDMSVLLHLAEAAPGLVSTEELLNRSWPGSVVGDNVVHQVIGRLRKALGDSARNPTYVETLPRRGYRLLQPVVPHEPTPVPPVLAPTPQTDRDNTPQPAVPAQIGLKPGLKWAAGVALVVVVASLIYLIASNVSREINPRSIAVLSFLDLSAKGELDTLGDDIARQLTTQLRKYGSLRLVGSSATLAYKDKDLDIQAIGENLSVAFVVSGTVLKDGDRLRVTIEMVSVTTLFQQWGNILYGITKDPLTAGRDIAIEAARDIANSFESDLPALQLPVKDQAPAEGDKPSLQDLFKQQSQDIPAPDQFPTLDDLDVQSFDEFGDVE